MTFAIVIITDIHLGVNLKKEKENLSTICFFLLCLKIKGILKYKKLLGIPCSCQAQISRSLAGAPSSSSNPKMQDKN